MDDNRLRGFSPPPWAALGRRDPNHEQAPWRESKNVEWRVNPSWAEWGSALVNDDLPYLPDRIARNISGWGVLPASDELMQRHMEDISRSLPQDETPRLGPNEMPMVYAERADGGPVDQPKQPSFSEPLSGFIDRAVGGLKDYGRSAMTEAGWAPWAKGAGEVAMSVATSPFESVSSASKLATASADWATGRQVSASPWDILSALPIAALGGARAAGHISRNRDALRRQDALDSLTGARRERGDLSGTDLRIKQLIDEMASRRNMD